MDYRWSCPSVAVLSVMITACAEPPDANLVTVTDSAAVEIVTNHRAFTDVPSRSVPELPNLPRFENRCKNQPPVALRGWRHRS